MYERAEGELEKLPQDGDWRCTDRSWEVGAEGVWGRPDNQETHDRGPEGAAVGGVYCTPNLEVVKLFAHVSVFCSQIFGDRSWWLKGETIITCSRLPYKDFCCPSGSQCKFPIRWGCIYLLVYERWVLGHHWVNFIIFFHHYALFLWCSELRSKSGRIYLSGWVLSPFHTFTII